MIPAHRDLARKKNPSCTELEYALSNTARVQRLTGEKEKTEGEKRGQRMFIKMHRVRLGLGQDHLACNNSGDHG